MEPAAMTTPAPAKPLTILLIEDSDTVRSFLHWTIKSVLPDATIVEAVEGRQALRELTRCRADLIISDLQMPNLDGPGLHKALRKRYAQALPRVIFVTGNAGTEDYVPFLADLRVPVLMKPLKPGRVLELVGRVLET